jgi:hypothetical protein
MFGWGPKYVIVVTEEDGTKSAHGPYRVRDVDRIRSQLRDLGIGNRIRASRLLEVAVDLGNVEIEILPLFPAEQLALYAQAEEER